MSGYAEELERWSAEGYTGLEREARANGYRPRYDEDEQEPDDDEQLEMLEPAKEEEGK